MIASATLDVVPLVPGCRFVALHSALGCGLIAPAGRILDLNDLSTLLWAICACVLADLIRNPILSPTQHVASLL